MGRSSPGRPIADRERGGDAVPAKRPTEERAHPFGACSRCGEPFAPGVRYPVTTERDADGTLRLHSFCDATCQRHWRRARD